MYTTAYSQFIFNGSLPKHVVILFLNDTLCAFINWYRVYLSISFVLPVLAKEVARKAIVRPPGLAPGT